MSVLVVDADADLLELLELVLAGQRVRASSRGDLALLTLLDAPPDVLVSELELPGLSGERLAARARALPDPPFVILISGDHERLARARSLADELLPKPFTLERLSEMVRAAGCCCVR